MNRTLHTPLPFDHLSLAEVAECDSLLALDGTGKLWGGWSYARLHRVLRKRHQPLYDAPPDEAA